MIRPEPPGSEVDAEAFELPDRHLLTLIDPSIANGLLSYANASQTSPTTQGSATSSPLYSQGLSAASGAAQSAHGAPNGPTIQNLNSPSSSGTATTSSG